ncbi:hypothetical protein [Nocardiopsis lambiniae]|uniref:DUF4333 domain-containing protein n=1 Tax=Nocardiopsis lambiniae TaxID=3075539 RepID=A0ABU2MF95_9ACTN|nr:hypothetical protein [Nocardiopsis sp. DSM 44743]MDT0330770.1 hypothetical protein [Nocardiopsis sp. DSM 44743]
MSHKGKLLVPAGTGSALNALYRYAERAPVRVRPPARFRVLPGGAVRALRVSAAVIGIAGGCAALLWGKYAVRSTAALTGSGTAEVVDVRTVPSRNGECPGRALVAYRAAEPPYRTTLKVECDDLPALESVGRIDVRWSATAPEHVRWVR